MTGMQEKTDRKFIEHAGCLCKADNFWKIYGLYRQLARGLMTGKRFIGMQ